MIKNELEFPEANYKFILDHFDKGGKMKRTEERKEMEKDAKTDDRFIKRLLAHFETQY